MNAPTLTLIKALLRGSEGLRSKELYEQIIPLGIEASLGTVSNAAVRLEGHGIVTRGDDQRWKLVKPEMAGVIGERGYVWGPADSFTMQELAAHRRHGDFAIAGS